MVPERGAAKLADFGIASLQGDPQLTSTRLVIGSPAYMAPEQARGEESGPSAEFWALGRPCSTRSRASRLSTAGPRSPPWPRSSTTRPAAPAAPAPSLRSSPPSSTRTPGPAPPAPRSGPGWTGCGSWPFHRRPLSSSGPSDKGVPDPLRHPLPPLHPQQRRPHLLPDRPLASHSDPHRPQRPSQTSRRRKRLGRSRRRSSGRPTRSSHQPHPYPAERASTPHRGCPPAHGRGADRLADRRLPIRPHRSGSPANHQGKRPGQPRPRASGARLDPRWRRQYRDDPAGPPRPPGTLPPPGHPRPPPPPLFKAGCRPGGGPSPTGPATTVSASPRGSRPAPVSATTPPSSRSRAGPACCSPCAPRLPPPRFPRPPGTTGPGRDATSPASASSATPKTRPASAGRGRWCSSTKRSRTAGGSMSATSTSRADAGAYNVEFIAPVDQWDTSQALARQFEQAFQPLG